MENLHGFETWFFGGLISLMLFVISFFAKSAWDDLKKIMEDQGRRIQSLERVTDVHEHKIESASESSDKAHKAFDQIMTKLNAMKG